MMSIFKIRDTEQMFSSVSGRRDSASIQGLFANWKIEKKNIYLGLRKRTSGIVTGDAFVSYWQVIFPSPQ